MGVALIGATLANARFRPRYFFFGGRYFLSMLATTT